jgi:hypothetical protein
MSQSQNRQQKRVLKQLFKSSQQTKIANRYISKLEEYKKLSFEELDQFAKDVYNKKVKLSKTDKEALYEIYRPLVFQKAMEKYKELNKEEPKTELVETELPDCVCKVPDDCNMKCKKYPN